MKKLLLLFILLIFFWGCEKDNPDANVSHSNAQSNVQNDDDGDYIADNCNVQGAWDVASLYWPPSYSGYEHPYCELFCGFEEVPNSGCESSNGYVDDYYEQCVDVVLSPNGDIDIVIWNLLAGDWQIDNEQNGTWTIPEGGNSCELLIIDTGSEGMGGIFEMTFLNSYSLLLENIENGTMYLLKK